MNSKYGIDIWSDGNFFIEDGLAKINHDCKPSIISIVKKIRKQGFKGPLLLRFPHLIQVSKSMIIKENLMLFFL